MKRFTDLIENYNDVGLKALSRIVEEPTEDQFNNEVDVAIKKSEGKIRNKRIAKPEVLAVEIEKEEVLDDGTVIEENYEEDGNEHPIANYKSKPIKGLYSYEHYEHPNGSWIQSSHSKPTKYIHSDTEGNQKSFDNMKDLKAHVQMKHDNTVKENIEEGEFPIKPKFKSVKETDKGPGIQACAEEIEEDTIDEAITNTRISSIRRRKLIQKVAGERDNRDKGKLNNIVSGLRNSSSGIKEEVEDLFEKTLTPAQKEKAEEVVKSMKEKTDEFKKKYGDRWKNIMYATASAIAKKKA